MLAAVFVQGGVACDPYYRSFTCAPLSREERSSALAPYRGSLQADRLKLAGSANWDPSDYIEDALYMAFREPDSLELSWVPDPGPQDVPLWHSESAAGLLKVMLLWDSRSLLRLSSQGPPSSRPYEAVRLFNHRQTDRPQAWPQLGRGAGPTVTQKVQGRTVEHVPLFWWLMGLDAPLECCCWRCLAPGCGSLYSRDMDHDSMNPQMLPPGHYGLAAKVTLFHKLCIK